MMEKKYRNKNAIRSRKLIINAYLELLQELPENKISVTKIVERADLNRSTFYAHFSNPHDILTSLEDDVVENLIKLINDVPLGRFLKDPLPLLSRIKDFITEHKEYHKLIANNRHSQHFFDHLKEILVDRMMEDKETIALAKNPLIIQANLRFFAGGYISLFQDWLSGQLDMSLDEMTEMTAKTISAGVSTFL